MEYTITIGQLLVTIVNYGLFFAPYLGFFRAFIFIGAFLEGYVGTILSWILAIIISYFWDKYVIRKLWGHNKGISHLFDDYIQNKKDKKNKINKD